MFASSQFLALLRSALDQPVEERAAFVLANSDDPALAQEVLDSLEDNFDGFLERPAVVMLIEAARGGR